MDKKKIGNIILKVVLRIAFIILSLFMIGGIGALVEHYMGK